MLKAAVVRSGSTRMGPERSGLEKDAQIRDGNGHAQIKKLKATKSGSSGPVSASKSTTAPILNPYRESNAQMTPPRVRFAQVRHPVSCHYFLTSDIPTQQKSSTVPRSPFGSKSTKAINLSPMSLPGDANIFLDIQSFLKPLK